ncbi:hypothetical protein SAMN05421823_101145 [Catalinimonas alkaloidigena]|uniref:Anti-sigma factor n=1 Tax=Catalinimonas alkaloidigena TaxID=1075417 RepID=A0A1G8WP46_9BACT|nr:anti-sigma factor [Catalinimonas alkaloidigena]SDJ80149.1 hypothetical protein SAMN05421823_101145 [Catalinimonas alkaloidigena]
MEDDLEKFIREHRDELDRFEPHPDLWQKIAHKLDETTPSSQQKNRYAWRRLLQTAAVAALLVFVGYALGWQDFHLTAQQEPVDTTAQMQKGPYLNEVEAYYTALIAQKKEDLAAVASEAEELEFGADLAHLDSMYVELRGELPRAADPQLVRAAMIQNLRLRIDLLNQQMQILKEVKQKKENANLNL